MNHAKKKRGVPDAMSGTPPRSVCGILCGQRKSAKPYLFQKLQKAKENTRNPKISGVVLSGGFNSDIFVLEALHRNGFEFSIEFRMRLFQIFADAIRITIRI